MITYKLRLYPNKKQQSKLWLHANKLNWLYNYFLNVKIEVYKKDRTTLSRYDLQKQLPELKEQDEILKQIHSQVIQQVTYRLDISYKNFFRRVKRGDEEKGFPNFRSCRNFFGIIYPQSGYSIQNNIFHTKIYGDVKFTKHRKIEGNIKTTTIKCENNKWFLCVTTDYEREKSGYGAVGIDVGITNLIATSERKLIKNKTHAKYFDKQINKLKSRRDKCKKRSRKSMRFNKVIQRLYDVKNYKVNDFLHKVSKNLSSEYGTIICENLNLKKMSESKIRGLNRELRNSQLAKFISYLAYKTGKLVKVPPQNTSKTCNNCGKKQHMPLHRRTYKCSCGYEEDRDINAAKNIFCLGQAILERECSVTLQEALAFRRG